MCEKFVHMLSWATRDVSQSKKERKKKKNLNSFQFKKRSREMEVKTEVNRCDGDGRSHVTHYQTALVNINHHF